MTRIIISTFIEYKAGFGDNPSSYCVDTKYRVDRFKNLNFETGYTENRGRKRRKPENVLRQKTKSLRLLPSDPDLVRTASLHKVPGVKHYISFSSFGLGLSYESSRTSPGRIDVLLARETIVYFYPLIRLVAFVIRFQSD